MELQQLFKIDENRYDEVVLKSDMPVVVYFYSDDCLPCITFSPLFDRMAGERKDIRFVKVQRAINRPLAERLNVKSSPTLLFFHAGEEVCTRLTGYITFQELSASLDTLVGRKCPDETKTKTSCDVLIIGAGPAGLTAAIYASRARLYTVVIESNLPGGQVATTFSIANYPGINGQIRGIDLMDNMKSQALSFGTQIDDLQIIEEMDLNGREKWVKTDKGEYIAKAVIIATGAEPRKLPVDNEKDYRSRGIHYCATCDGAMYPEANVIVVGGGVSAIEEAEFLTRYAKHVTIVNRGTFFKAPKGMIDSALANPLISVLWNSVITEVKGDNFVTSVVLKDTVTGVSKEMPIDAVFVYIGNQPNSAIFGSGITTVDRGYIQTDEAMMTNIPGVFAVGDIRNKEIRQITTAVGDGTIAGVMVERYINNRITANVG